MVKNLAENMQRACPASQHLDTKENSDGSLLGVGPDDVGDRHRVSGAMATPEYDGKWLEDRIQVIPCNDGAVEKALSEAYETSIYRIIMDRSSQPGCP